MNIFRPIFAILFLLPMLIFSQNNSEKEEMMLTFFQKGYQYIYIKKDSAFYHLEKALKVAREIGDVDSSLGILDHIIITADYHFDLPKYRNSLQRVNALLSKEGSEKEIQNIDNWRQGHTLWLAAYHFEIMDYVGAKKLFLDAKKHFDSIPYEEFLPVQAERLYTIYSSLGTTYMNLGNYELAELNYMRSVDLVNTATVLEQNSEAYLNGANQSMAQLYTRMGRHKQAAELYIKNLNTSKEYFEKDNRYKNNLVNAFQKITISYIEQDSLQQALYMLNQSRSYLLEHDSFLKDAFILYGDIYTGLNEPKKALFNYEEALKTIHRELKNPKHQYTAEVFGKIAILHLRQKDFKSGLNAIRAAYNKAGYDVQITDDGGNPNPDSVFSKVQLLQLLDTKLQLLQLAYRETSQFGHLQNALETNGAILKTFDALKSEFDSKFDKKFLAEKTYPIFHRMLDVVYDASVQEPSDENFQQALNIAEKNKDFLLLEALRNTQASEFGIVPQEILDKEARLRTEMTYLEKEIFKASEPDDTFQKKLFNAKQHYYSFLDTLRIEFPKYHSLKYELAPIKLETIRHQLLEDDGILISFTLTDNYLYAIVLHSSKEKFLKIPFADSDKRMIRDFYDFLSKPSISESRSTISELSKALYSKILKKPLEGLPTENLTIIPDGELHYLPFDLLQKNGAYLLNTSIIGYGNSVSSLLELKTNDKSEKNNILAFAPIFNGVSAKNTDRDFGKLLYNRDEVSKIGSFFDTETVIDNKATLKNFKAKSSDFNVLHLATHASANDQFPDYSYLAFTEQSDEENVLYIKDLYNMSLNVDMVTLSACQTGIGKLQKGQGMLSLSKGFYYAGAKSLVNTLWKINDKSTVTLMEYFYQGLGKGKSKSEALRDAKLKYLESIDDDLLKHPYYWAAFTVSGNTAPLQSSSAKLWWLLLLVPVAIFGFLRFRK